MKAIMAAWLIFLCFAPLGLMAQEEAEEDYSDFGIVKDSFYFMKDDNEFSPEEKDEEALYIHRECEANAFYRDYFDCGCIAGAYRMARDDGPLVPQDSLFLSMFKKHGTDCADPVLIAGQTYEFCQDYAKGYRPREKNNEEYCECVSNKMAKDFIKDPQLRTSHVTDLRVEALSHCRIIVDKIYLR